MTACEHDWRVNPHLTLMSYPPQSQLVCAKCGAVKGSGIDPDWQPVSHDPRDWPRSEQPLIEEALKDAA